LSREIVDKELQRVLLESPENVAELLRSVAHPVRIRILASLLRGENDFSKLMQATALSKTALANHLTQLINSRLIERVARGEYRLTGDGRDLLGSAVSMYKNSARREEQRTELLLRRYTKGLSEGKTMSKKVISKKVEYQPCWLSYTGAMAGALRGLGVNCDTADVGGYSGYSFIINVAKGVTCPSGPTALPAETWKEIHKGTESLGYALEWGGHHGSYPVEPGKPTPEELEIVRKLFEKIKREIDEQDQPVVLWGLVIPEYGIVKGYEGNAYIVSTFRSLAKQPEEPVLFYNLDSPGAIDAFFFRKKSKGNSKATDLEALERAIRFASGNTPIHPNYVGGPASLEEWANVLEAIPEQKQNYMGNSYVGACVYESRNMCAQFLRRLAQKHPGESSKHLQKAAECYEKELELLKEFTVLFPFKHQGEMKAENRKKGAEILGKVKPLEELAFKHMRNASKEL
jgi:DNA-binding HxlR family transcriptional regulator